MLGGTRGKRSGDIYFAEVVLTVPNPAAHRLCVSFLISTYTPSNTQCLGFFAGTMFLFARVVVFCLSGIPYRIVAGGIYCGFPMGCSRFICFAPVDWS